MTLGPSGTVEASVVVPSGVTLMSHGATLKPPHGAKYLVATGGPGTHLRNLTFNTATDSGLSGGEATVLVRHDDARVTDCSISGSGFRWGIALAGTSIVRNTHIARCNFTNTSYGVVKNGTPTENLAVLDCSFTDIRRGDAIELNTGGDNNAIIAGNRINGVRADGLVNAGIGIGVAGSGGYGQPADGMSSNVTVTNNVIVGVENEAIHFEVMRRSMITSNTIVGGASTGRGISSYGSVEITIAQNEVSVCAQYGILDCLGSAGSSYIRSTTGTIISSNLLSYCQVGIKSIVAGDGTTCTCTHNVIKACSTGVSHEGSASVSIIGNTVHDSSLSAFVVHLSPPDTSHLVSTTAGLVFTANKELVGSEQVSEGILDFTP